MSAIVHMKEQTTLKKLANMLNVSIATVSRALKDHPDISEETKKRVKELAASIDYNPNPYAVSLRKSTSKELAIIVPMLSNFFYHLFVSSVEEEARRYGYSVTIYRSNDDPVLEAEILQNCRQKRMDGIFVAITSGTTDVSHFRKLESMGTPVIFFDKVPESNTYNKACVADRQAAVLASEALIKKQKKHILCIFGHRNMSITRVRIEGLQATFAAQAPTTELRIIYAHNAEAAEQCTLEALDQPIAPDAIFCMSDEILVGVMKAIQRRGIQFPAQIGIVAISDGFIPRLYFPEITYAETSGFKLGKLAFTRMMACLAGSTFAQTLTADAILIDGGSL